MWLTCKIEWTCKFSLLIFRLARLKTKWKLAGTVRTSAPCRTSRAQAAYPGPPTRLVASQGPPTQVDYLGRPILPPPCSKANTTGHIAPRNWWWVLIFFSFVVVYFLDQPNTGHIWSVHTDPLFTLPKRAKEKSVINLDLIVALTQYSAALCLSVDIYGKDREGPLEKFTSICGWQNHTTEYICQYHTRQCTHVPHALLDVYWKYCRIIYLCIGWSTAIIHFDTKYW